MSDVITAPFCTSCGYDLNKNYLADDFCDSCGHELVYSLGAGGAAPAAPVGTPAAGNVSFAWTANTAADSEESQVSVDGALAVWSAWAADTSPTVVAATVGTVVGIRVRSIVNGIPGPYVQSSGTTA